MCWNGDFFLGNLKKSLEMLINHKGGNSAYMNTNADQN